MPANTRPAGEAPMVICASCGADWSEGPCDTGCPNDLDTAAREDVGILSTPGGDVR